MNCRTNHAFPSAIACPCLPRDAKPTQLCDRFALQCFNLQAGGSWSQSATAEEAARRLSGRILQLAASNQRLEETLCARQDEHTAATAAAAELQQVVACSKEVAALLLRKAELQQRVIEAQQEAEPLMEVASRRVLLQGPAIFSYYIM